MCSPSLLFIMVRNSHEIRWPGKDLGDPIVSANTFPSAVMSPWTLTLLPLYLLSYPHLLTYIHVSRLPPSLRSHSVHKSSDIPLEMQGSAHGASHLMACYFTFQSSQCVNDLSSPESGEYIIFLCDCHANRDTQHSLLLLL